MKRLLLPALLLFLTAVRADPQIPDKLVGVWTTDGSVLKHESLVSGQALYIDIDGRGAMVSNGPKGVSRTRIAITSYDENTRHIEVDNGTGKITLNYEPTEAAITTSDADAAIYHRRKELVSPETRKALGLKEMVNEAYPLTR